MLQRICTFLLLVSSFACLAQQGQVRGKVTDKATGQPLAFANIIFNGDARLGITADINGSFSYSGPAPLYSLKCSYVGYTDIILPITPDTGFLVIEMEFSANELNEVVITPGENPANAIMRKVIANKELNNPENLETFRYRCYNKVTFDMKNRNVSDSLTLAKLLKNGHIFMMESYTERRFAAPDNSEEVVLATKVSGFQNPTFATLATDLQPFSFYKDNIPFFNVNYLNPVSSGSLNKYRFTLQDTLYSSQDTVYVISYKPLPRKNFEALTGLLYINTNKYAIQNVTATPFEKGKIDLRKQQPYTLTDDGHWFPQQLEYAMDMNDYPEPGKGMQIQGKSYIDSITINKPVNKKDFRIESVWIQEGAAKKDSTYWGEVRSVALDSADLITYRVIDSLGAKHNFDRVLTLTSKLIQGRVPVKFIDIDLGKTIVYNKYEGIRLGLGLYTNERLFEKLELGGFAGYGTKDHEWKYGGSFNYEFSKRNEFNVGMQYQDNIVEAGNHGYHFPEFNYYDFRAVIASRFDRLREETLYTSFRAMRYTKWNISLNHAKITPKYEYAFGDVPPYTFRYTNTSLGVKMRFAFKEKLVESFGRRMTTDLPYPVLFVYYTRGLGGFMEGDYNYNKIEAVLQHTFFTKNLGNTTFRAEGGFIDKPLPYGLLFTGEGSYDKSVKVIVRNTFQTMLPYEFLSDRYVNLFATHNFGGLLFSAGDFQPHVSIHHSIGWGDLKHPALQNTGDFVYRVKDKLYLESGLQLDHILKVNYVNLGYLGIGAGAFYRHGAYAYDSFNDNLAIKLTAAFTFK